MNQIPTAAPYLSIEERKALMQKNDVRAFIEILFHWAFIFLLFYLIYLLPTWYIILPALFLLGGSQLSCAVLMHDSAHLSVFNSKGLNDFLGNWLGGYPVFNRVHAYRPYHQLHHITTGTIEDPDLLLTRGYPTSQRSMVRKMCRDLFGITGIKSLVALFAMHIGIIKYTQSGNIEKVANGERQVDWYGLFGSITANVILFIILALLFDSRIYIFWMLAYLTTFQFCLRIRSIAEHSVVENTTDPIRNTRTTRANFLERLLFAPYHVNYHLEHHMLMSVPSYNLPKMHHLLIERGFYEKGLLASGYWEIIKMAASKKSY